MSKGLSWQEALAQVTAPGSQFAISERVIDGVACRVFENAPPSLRAVFETARSRGDEIFLVYEDERWSFANVMAKVDAVAALMVERYGLRS